MTPGKVSNKSSVLISTPISAAGSMKDSITVVIVVISTDVGGTPLRIRRIGTLIPSSINDSTWAIFVKSLHLD
jgi:hypothetical protein